MSSLPPSAPPPGVPSSGGNGKYVIVAVILLLGMGGLAYWRLHTPDDPKPNPIPTASVTGTPTNTGLVDFVPPPPDEPDSGPDTGAKVVATATGPALNPCDVRSCNGSASTDMSNGLALLARQTRRKCYEPALSQDPTLAGKVTVSVKVASNGQICSANVAKNEMSITSVGECAARMIASSGRVPPPTGGCVNVDFPLNYVPQPGH
ncbi:hypothetical protein BH09MYX1_BH09MYX1_42940 [soil metagenome]